MQMNISQTRLSGMMLCLLIALMPLNHITLPGLGAAYQPVLLLVALIYVLDLFKNKKGVICIEQSTKLWTLFSFIELISLFWAENLQRSSSQIVGIAETYILAILAINASYVVNQKKAIYNAFLFSGMVYIIFAQFFTVDQIYTGRKMITFGAYGSMDPNEWCSYMIVPVAVSLYRFFEDRRIQVKLLYICYILLTLYCALLEGSRGGLLALLVTILLVVRKEAHLSAKALLGGVLSCAVMVFIVWRFILPLIPETIMQRFTIQGMTAYGGAGGRGELWIEIFKYLWDHPLRLLIGNGLYGSVSVPFVAHNQLLQVLMDMGIIGLSVYLAFLLQVHKKMREKGVVELAAFWGMQVALLSLTGYSWLKSSWIVIIICLINYTDVGNKQYEYTDERERAVP